MYAELIIGLNMLFNFAVLSFANKVGNIQAGRGRLVFASFIGAVPVTLFPQALTAVILSFFVMTITAFGKAFILWRKSATMVLVGAAFAGGLLTAFQYRIDTPLGNLSVLMYAIIAYLALNVMKSKWLDVRTARQVTDLMALSTLTIWEAEISLTVFVDSGNSCTEPLSGAPVQFVSLSKLESFIPEDLKVPLHTWNPEGPSTLTNFPEKYLKDIRLVRLLTVQGWSWAVGFKYDTWLIEGGGLLEKGYIVVTKADRRYPEGAEAILHVSAMEMINGGRGIVHAT